MLTTLLVVSSMLAVQDGPECRSVRYGKFRIDQTIADSTVTTYLERKDDLQFERNYQFGVEYKFIVDWIDDCTYTLTLLETIRDENDFGYPDNELITVRIKEVNEEYYMHVTQSKFYDMEFESKVTILK